MACQDSGVPARVIAHVDLDAFFAAVEQRDRPELRGKPVLVGGTIKRGVVAACSYEARRFGIRSAMPMAEAMRRCPHAIVVPHRMSRYAEASRGFFQILSAFSPEVEGLSFDEAFLELTGTERLLGPPLAVAREIKRRVRAELSLVASVGIAPVKLAAKIASDLHKPDGLRVVEPAELLPFLHGLPLSRLWGVGEVTAEKLAALGLTTIGDVARYPEHALVARLGETTGRHLAALARGEDPRPVHADESASSIGHQETFEQDHDDPADLVPILLSQADRVATRLRAAAVQARVVVLIIKYDDFRQITRRATLPSPSSDGNRLAAAVVELLGKVELGPARGRRVRLCGVSATSLVARDAPRQLSLGQEEEARGERLGQALDKVRERFGGKLVRRAVHLGDSED